MGIGNRHLPEDVKQRLVDIQMHVYGEQGPGQHLTSETYHKIYDHCQREGLTVTMDDVKQAHRDSAGYP